jgi:hypothetical protein
MATPNEFWLALHVLCEAYEAEGMADCERVANITQQFQRMPPVVQRQVLREFQQVSLAMPGVGESVTSAYRAALGESIAEPKTI